MSSIDKNSKNNIKITLYQVQLCRNISDYIPYNISIKYNDSKEYETEQINIQNKKFINKNDNFNILTFSRKQNHIITLTAFKRSLFVKKTFSKLNILINVNNNKNKEKQWFYMKDNNEEIILKILLSIEFDISLYQNNSMNHLNRSYRGEISFDIFNKKNLNDSSF